FAIISVSCDGAHATGKIMDPVFDSTLLVARKRRAFRQARPGADFLMRRAADDLAERLSAVGRDFTRAATFFCITDAAKDALLASGKVDSVVRVEADADFLDGDE